MKEKREGFFGVWALRGLEVRNLEGKVEIRYAIERWSQVRYAPGEYNRCLMDLSFEFRIYEKNIFILNSKALIIQHAYFKRKASNQERNCSTPEMLPTETRKFDVGRKSTCVSHNSQIEEERSFMSSTRVVSSPSMACMTERSNTSEFDRSIKASKSKANTYKAQEDERKERENRIIEARKKYGSSSRLLASKKQYSRPSTAEKKRKPAKAPLQKKETITDAELQCVMQKAWINAEKEKQKKQLAKTKKPKRPPLRTQESINEEILVNQIVSKAFVEADHLKKKKDKQKAKRKKSANKPKKPALRSQDSIQEEQMFSQIMSEAWQKAEKLKEKTKKMRKKAAENRTKPKLHSQQSIMEEQAVKKIVNKAWENTHLDSKVSRLDYICENNYEDESSFEGSDSDETPKTVEIQSSKIEKIEKRVQEVPENKRQRRSRANRMGSKDMTSSTSKQALKKNLVHEEIICKSPLKESNYNSCVGRTNKTIEVSQFDSSNNQENLQVE